MLKWVVTAVLFLAATLPIGAFYLSNRSKGAFKTALGVNIASFFGVLFFATVVMFSGSAFAAVAQGGASTGDGLRYLAAALSTGLSSLGAGIATGRAASAALGALSENEAIMGKSLIFVALCEGIGIYGLLISFMILG